MIITPFLMEGLCSQKHTTKSVVFVVAMGVFIVHMIGIRLENRAEPNY
jgi:hypothetical protein